MSKVKISSLSPAPLVLLTAIAALFTVPLRTFQLINLTEPSTGFWLRRDFSVPLLYTILIAITFLCLVLAFLSGIMPEPRFPKKRNIPLGISSLLFAASFVADAVSSGSRAVILVNSFDSSKFLNIFSYLLSTGGLALVFRTAFAILSFIYFCIFSLSLFIGKLKYRRAKLIALSPTLWGISAMMFYFSNPISYKNVSQLLLELGTLSLFIIFSLSFARIASGVNEYNSSPALWFSGSAGILFGLTASLCPLSLLITGKSEFIAADYPLQYTDLCFAVFAAVLLLSLLPRTIKSKTEA